MIYSSLIVGAAILFWSGTFVWTPDARANDAPVALAKAAVETKILAAVQARIRDSENAVTLTSEGRSLYESDTNKRSAYEYCSQAIGLAERGEFRESIRAAAKALFLGQSTNKEDHVAHAKRDLAMAYLYAGDLTHAEQYAREAIEHYKDARNRNAVDGGAYKTLGDVALRHGRYENAFDYYDKSIDRAEGGLRFYARAALASSLVAAGQLDRAPAAIENAESYIGTLGPQQRIGAGSLIARIRGALALKGSKTAQAISLYRSAISSDSGTTKTAYDRFWMLEGLSRAQLLAGDRVGALASLLTAVGEIDQVRSRFYGEEIKSGLLGEMQSVFDQAVRMLLESGHIEKAWEISERGRSRALSDMLRNRIKASSMGGAFSEASGNTATHGALLESLKPNEVIASYRVLDDVSMVWISRRSGTRVAQIQVGKRDLARRIEDFRDSIVANTARFQVTSHELHELLIKPLGLIPDEKLILIPHDSLHYLPFQALWNGKKFLIQENPISILPSGTALISLQSQRAGTSEKILAFGNPDLGDPALALPGAQKEVEAIGKLYPGMESFMLTEATRDRLLTTAPQAKFVHVAAHGTVDAVDPLYSKLYMAKQINHSGTIEAREIYELNLQNTEMVVLSACESGLGRVTTGDEIWGFTRSFLSAGAASLVVSLWPVSDEATELLMTNFYGELRKGIERGQALRNAEILVMATPKYSAPLFWAAFSLVGTHR